MANLEDIVAGSQVKGIVPDDIVSIIAVEWFGNNVIEVTYKNSSGGLGHEMIYRGSESNIEVMSEGLSWSFDADASQMKLLVQLVLPLFYKTSRCYNQASFQIAACYKLLNKKTGHNGLSGTGIIR